MTDSNATASNPTTSSPATRRTFFIVLALFFAPLLVAFALYYGSGWRPQGTTNKGELITPVVPLPAVTLPTAQGGNTDARFLRDVWTLVYRNEGACAEACQQSLHTMQTVRQLLGKDLQRTASAVLVTGACCEAALLAAAADVTFARVDDAAGQQLLSLLPRGPEQGSAGQQIFIVDPLGNLMMSYRPGTDPRDIYQDLKKLLKLSHIG